MKNRSLQFRLTVWYSLVLLTVTAVLFVSFYAVTRRTFYRQTDDTLRNHAQAVASAVAGQGQNAQQLMAGHEFLTRFSEIPGMLVIVINRSGTVVAGSQGIPRTSDAFTGTFRRILSGETAVYENQEVSNSPFRFLAVPVVSGGTVNGVVVIGHPIEVITRSLHTLLLTLISVSILFIVPAVYAGHLMARSALAPIIAMSDDLSRITSENLDERLTVSPSRDQVGKLADTVNGMLDRMQAAFVRERQFIADVAHEMKTPLSMIRGDIEVMLMKQRTAAELTAVLRNILGDTERLSGTLQHVLDLARSAAGPQLSGSGLCRLSDLADTLLDTAVKMAQYKQITVTGSITPALTVRGSYDDLQRAFLAIIDNAVRYTPRKGRIRIRLSESDGYAMFRVSDTGVGIAARDLPHVRERFYRGTRTAGTSGSGLGLAIAQAVITAHNGTLRVRSSAGKGTVITVTILLASS